MCDACKNAAREALMRLTGPQQGAVEGLYRTQVFRAEQEAAEERRAAYYAEGRLEEAREAFADLEAIAADRPFTVEDLGQLREALLP